MQMIEKITELIYPPKCVICEKILPMGQKICDACRKNLPFNAGVCCMKCGKPLAETQEYCNDCMKRTHYFAQGVALWSYSPLVKKSLYRFKYSNKRVYAKYYAEELTKRYKNYVNNWKIEAIVCVPLHAAKKRSRGYNQAELLGEELSRQLQIPFYSNCLKRMRKTVPQKELNDKERTKNVKNAFKLNENSVKLKRVLLVDDIYTTGATVDEAARILLQAGAEAVYVMTICVGRGF